jgi:hypothetical protein
VTRRGARPLRAAACASIAALASACAGVYSGDDSPSDPDASPPGDAPAGCQLDVVYDPVSPTAGPGNIVEAHVLSTGTSGLVEYLWEVRSPAGVPLTLAPTNTADTVQFPVEEPGDYAVLVAVTSQSCPTYDASLHVLAPGANMTTWRFRLTPPASSGAPPQEIVRSIPSLSSFDLGDIILDAGVPVSATVRNPAGTGVPAYLRVTSGAGFTVEAYAAAGTGAVAAQIPVGAVDVLVVPEASALAPILVEDWDGGDITVDGGTLVTGTVLDPEGSPLAGARVSLVVDGVPSTIDTTDAAGVYRVRARAGAAIVVKVVPDDADGLPELTAPLAAALSSPIDVAYAPGLARRDLAGTAIRYAGDAAANAVVTFTGAVPDAGTATMGATSAAVPGNVALTFVANAAGDLVAPARAPAAVLRAVVVPELLVASTVSVNIATDPASISAPAMASLSARVVGGAAGVSGVRVTALPVGPLALGTITPVTGTTAADGTVLLDVAPGGAYDLVFDDPHKAWARAWRRAVLPGAIGDVVVEPAMRVRGTIKRPGGSGAVRSCAVQAFCYGCSGLAAERPEGESSTNVTGGFSLVVTDPGVGAATIARFAFAWWR